MYDVYLLSAGSGHVNDMCMCVYMYVDIYVHTHTHISMHACIYVCGYVRCVCMYPHTHSHTFWAMIDIIIVSLIT